MSFPPERNRRSIRLRDYDYSQNGVYFVTICTKDREHLFGEICCGKMQLNSIGKIASEELLNTEKIRDNVFFVGAYCTRLYGIYD